MSEDGPVRWRMAGCGSCGAECIPKTQQADAGVAAGVMWRKCWSLRNDSCCGLRVSGGEADATR